jgi:hypothetical protein
MLELTVNTRVRVVVENNKWVAGTVTAVEDNHWEVTTDMLLANGGMGEPNNQMLIVKENQDIIKLYNDPYFETVTAEFLLG